MKRSRIVSIDTAIYRETPDGEELEIEVEVSGTANPYWPGDYDNPPEGGDIEDIRATHWIPPPNNGKKCGHVDIELSDAELKQFTEDLADHACDY